MRYRMIAQEFAWMALIGVVLGIIMLCLFG
jgi:hypothetical protein